jgi:hypothetical protein
LVFNIYIYILKLKVLEAKSFIINFLNGLLLFDFSSRKRGIKPRSTRKIIKMTIVKIKPPVENMASSLEELITQNYFTQ